MTYSEEEEERIKLFLMANPKAEELVNAMLSHFRSALLRKCYVTGSVHDFTTAAIDAYYRYSPSYRSEDFSWRYELAMKLFKGVVKEEVIRREEVRKALGNDFQFDWTNKATMLRAQEEANKKISAWKKEGEGNVDQLPKTSSILREMFLSVYVELLVKVVTDNISEDRGLSDLFEKTTKSFFLMVFTVGRTCPGCKGELNYDSKTGKWYCEKCAHPNTVSVPNVQVQPLPSPPLPPPPVQICPTCGRQLTFIQQYNRWYCFNCKKYT